MNADQTTTDDRPASRPGRRPATLTVVVGVAVAVVVVIGAIVWWPTSTPSNDAADANSATGNDKLQLPDLTGADPAIAAAIEQAAAHVREQPDDGPAWGQLGMVLLAHEFDRDAAAALAEAERLDPKQPRWPYLRCMALIDVEPDDAVRHLERAVKLCDIFPSVVRAQLADLLLQLDRLDEAERHYQRLLATYPDHERAHLGMGRLRFRQGKYAESIEHLKQSVDHTSAAKASHLLLAQAYLRLGQTKEAQRHEKEAQRPNDPPWPDPFQQQVLNLVTGFKADLVRAAQLMDAGRNADAARELFQVADRYPESHTVFVLLGKALIRSGKPAAAEQPLRRALQLAPNSIEACFQLGLALHEMKQIDDAVEMFRKATELKPDFALAHYNLGYCLQEKDQLPEALAAYERAVAAEPDFAQAHEKLGDVLAKTGQRKKGLYHLRVSLKLNPSNTWVRNRIKEVEREIGPDAKE